jgi:chromosome segregation ATPase
VNGWLTAAVTAASALLGGAGFAALINAFTGRRTRRVEVADRLSDSSLKWVQEFQEETQTSRRETAEARRETAEARREIEALRREVADVRHEAEGLATKLHKLTTAIHDPYMSLDRLRVMVPLPPNGSVAP